MRLSSNIRNSNSADVVTQPAATRSAAQPWRDRDRALPPLAALNEAAGNGGWAAANDSAQMVRAYCCIPCRLHDMQ